jgi:hypothetical protein
MEMMGQIDQDPIPKWAVTCWCSDHDIFVALPMSAGGPAYIMRFALNEGGLSAALEVLRKRPKEVIAPTLDRPANYTIPAHQPQVKVSKAQERLYSETTESQRENARKLLAKLGLK